jgi:hypothetical protein
MIPALSTISKRWIAVSVARFAYALMFSVSRFQITLSASQRVARLLLSLWLLLMQIPAPLRPTAMRNLRSASLRPLYSVNLNPLNTYKEKPMTQNTTLADIANEIEALDAQLIKINALVELIGEPAVLKADEVAKALVNAKERYADALANKATVEREERLKGFTNICVDTTPGENLMNTTFIIRYTRLSWDMSINESVPKEHKSTGFAGLDDAAYEYLVTKKPEAIPAQIMALAPGNPHDAFSLYFIGKKRGHFNGEAAAA